MSAAMKGVGPIEKLVKVLAKQHRVLAAALADKDLLAQYGALIRFLRRARTEELHRIFSHEISPRAPDSSERSLFSEAQITNLPLSEVERIIHDQSISRKDLERVAVHRFQVPVGSMRSFPNRERLVNKLLTLLRNEQAHRTIEAVARGHAELPGMGARSKEKAG